MLITIKLNRLGEFTIVSEQFRSIQRVGLSLNWVKRSLNHSEVREGLQVVVRCHKDQTAIQITDWCMRKDYKKATKDLKKYRSQRSSSRPYAKTRAAVRNS